jgi:hypothetical protein
MKKKLLCCLAASIILLAGFAQNKIKFSSINMTGIAIGQGGNFGLAQTVNGIRYQKWFIGIGAGIDYYKNKTIQLFIDIRSSIAKTNLFAFADAGYNFSSKNKPDEKVLYYTTYDFFGGFYNELGVGYKVRLAGKSHLLFTSGYSYKELNNKTGVVNPCLVGPCPVDYSTYKYNYGRILFKTGIIF